jgi:protein-L-isoaspartate(D-aspartate) O-methyltransferase
LDRCTMRQNLLAASFERFIQMDALRLNECGVNRGLCGPRRTAWFPFIVLAFFIALYIDEAYADAEARKALVAEIADDFRMTADATGRAAPSPRVLDALGRVPREEFVPESQRRNAYQNRPLPIGHGQTISQPFIVALMTDLLDLKPDSRVLEVGTGSGYQAAVLGKLAKEVYTIEIIKPLGERAGETLRRLGYDNVSVRIGDGYAGWPEHAPFDAIIVTAAPETVPPALIEQLKPGGRMVLPLGAQFEMQELLILSKDADGTVRTTKTLPVSFVPMTGRSAQPH